MAAPGSAAAGSNANEGRFDGALNLINQAVDMLRGRNTSEREGSASNELQQLPMATASTSSNTGPTARPTELFFPVS